MPNGLAFTPDEKILYINDTDRGHIRAFDVAADGTLTNGRVFADRTPGADGMKVDTEGNVYCASKTRRDGVRPHRQASRHIPDSRTAGQLRLRRC